MRTPTLSSSRLGRLVAERIAALRGQLAAVAAEAVERATRSVGSAVGEAVRSALRAAAGRSSPPVPPMLGHVGAERYEEAPWDDPADPIPGPNWDPWGEPSDSTVEVDPWGEATEYSDVAPREQVHEPREFVEQATEPHRSWWSRLADRVAGVFVPGRLTRASVTAAVVAGVVTLFPPGVATVVGAALAALAG